MQLSIRLSAIAKFVPQGSRVIDVGTDHAYIPIYLITQGIAKSCLATDINKGPLEKARKNLIAHKISNVKLKQTNGLEGIPYDAGEVVMISGMGGYLIVDILERSKSLVEKMNKLILQPQQDIDEVRKYLHTIGFKIEDEDFVEDEGKYYTIIVAVPGQECYEETYEYTYGKCLIQKKLPLFKTWITEKRCKQEGIYAALESQNSESALQRKEELMKEIQILREVEACLD